MIKRNLFLTSVFAVTLCACSGKAAQSESTAENNDSIQTAMEPATVYYTQEITPESLVEIFEALGVEPKGTVAVKISTGESSKSNHLSPELIKNLVQKVNGTLVECNTAYDGNRRYAEDHYKAIAERGYDKIAKVDVMDADGNLNIPVRDTTWIHYDIVGSHLPNYDFMINLAHFKGHQMGGFGGVLKNASIGVASADGKAYIHSAGVVDTPEHIWEHVDNQDGFLESMAAAAQGVHDYFKQPGKNIVYINVMNNMSIDCDCNGDPASPELLDMGIMASTDPVALDQACIDMVFNHENKEGDTAAPLIQRIHDMHGLHTIDHAEKIGLGTKKYNLVKMEK